MGNRDMTQYHRSGGWSHFHFFKSSISSPSSPIHVFAVTLIASHSPGLAEFVCPFTLPSLQRTMDFLLEIPGS